MYVLRIFYWFFVKQIKTFWNWYNNKLLESIMFLLIVQVLQIPHWIWSHSLFAPSLLPSLPLWLDYAIWSVDLLEIPTLINTVLLALVFLKKKMNK